MRPEIMRNAKRVNGGGEALRVAMQKYVALCANKKYFLPIAPL